MASVVAMASSGARAFVYGSLQADEVVSILIGRVPESHASYVNDFRRFRIKGENYPAVIPAQGERVHGKVLFGLNEKEVDILDEFEDVQYVKRTVKPVLVDGESHHRNKDIDAFIYVWSDPNDPNLYGEWDFEEWRSKYLDSFCSMCKEFKRSLDSHGN